MKIMRNVIMIIKILVVKIVKITIFFDNQKCNDDNIKKKIYIYIYIIKACN